MKSKIFLSALIVFYTCTPLNVQARKNSDPTPTEFVTQICLFTILLGCILYLDHKQKKQYGKGDNPLWTVYQPGQIHETFDSVAGADEAKDALKEIVQFLKNPEYASRLGAKMPKGVLLTGEPGTGKTLLARAVAGEANCSFINASGSAFEEIYAGVGAARIRALFAEAKKQQGPCIIFIDEIDVLGAKRTQDHTWLNQKLNELLTCMDGFSSKDQQYPIIVIGATNHESMLDSALLRPGRFDRIIEVPLPSLHDRIEMLKIHLQNVICSDDLNLEIIAKNTAGLSGADLAQLINQATLIATKNNQDCVCMQNFNEAIDLIKLGAPAKNIKMSAREKKITAYHEAGHTLLHLLQPELTAEFYNVTIVPRSRALGLMSWFPEENKYSENKEELLARIAVLLAGRAAEELMFGEIGTGPHNDFEHASNIAFHMVCTYGMSELGTRIYDINHVSDATRALIDQEVNKILDQQYKKVMIILQKNKEKLIKLSEALLKKETLYAPEVYEILELPAYKPTLT